MVKGENMLPTNGFRVARKLVPIFAAHDELDEARFTLLLARTAAARGETVLMLDCQDGLLMQEAGIVYNKTLFDVLYDDADIRDVKYVTSNEHFTAMATGDLPLETVLGSLAALSLEYDWVFVGVPAGCTPEHVRLAGAADISLLGFDSGSDHFMRAYWMIDAIRQHHPLFDPYLVSFGNPLEAAETSMMLRDTVNEYLGAPPPYVGHGMTPVMARAVLRLIDESSPQIRVA